MIPEKETYFAITPIDGRYKKVTKKLKDYLSESALIHYRIKVEILWLAHLLEMMEIDKLPSLFSHNRESLAKLKVLAERDFREEAPIVKEIESTTNHDVKACEYYLQKLFDQEKLPEDLKSFIHFGCTSEDINNLSYGLMLKDIREQVLLTSSKEIEEALSLIAFKNKAAPLLSKTHGQSASPTTLGKEIALFLHRLRKQRKNLEEIPLLGKINGAVGNYNAHYFVFESANWQDISKSFVENKLGLTWNPYTTQIENHDALAILCQNISLTSTISIGLCQDMWSYISTDTFGQKALKNEVGSSTMPHKVNPIDFENAEGNYGLARSVANHLAEKLPISRRQRDLSDSTAQRALGTLFGHFYLAGKSLLKGLGKVEAKQEVMAKELENHWEILAEPIQMLLRRYGVTDAYEKLKHYSRGKALGRNEIKDFIESLNELPIKEKERLQKLSPESYLGIAEKLTEEILNESIETN